jgi:predicted ATP-grasp superfamily ATP-dependent carboligase
MPEGVRLGPADPWPDDFPLPAVLKPNDGCGSNAVYWFEYPAGDRRTAEAEVWRLERWVAGEPASVAMLGGGGRYQMSAPCRQRFDGDLLPVGGERVMFCGGSCSMPDLMNERFVRLLQRVWPAMPDFNGYIGLDVVLGDADDGSQDYVIEVNPRLTTSYVVQREMIRNNLMQVMLDLRNGRETPLQTRCGSAGYDLHGEVFSIVQEE